MQLLQSTKRSGMMGMTFAAGILMLAVLTGCGSLAGNMVRGSGQIKSETRPVDGVTAVTDAVGEST